MPRSAAVLKLKSLSELSNCLMEHYFSDVNELSEPTQFSQLTPVVLVVVVRLEPRRGPCGHRDYCACLCYRCGSCGHNVRTLRSHRKCPY